jgi:hypothetical protein
VNKGIDHKIILGFIGKYCIFIEHQTGYIRLCIQIVLYRITSCIGLVFNATFNNISVLSWRSILLVEETGENHQPATSHWQTLELKIYLI